MRLLLAILAAAWPLAACSCSPESKAIGPHLYYTRPTIVVARAIDHDGDSGNPNSIRVYRFRIVENIKGGPEPGVEIFLAPGGHGMCGTTFELGRTYLLYPDEPSSGVSVFGGLPGWPSRPLPAAWKGREQLRLFVTSVCDPQKRIANLRTDPDLRDLRARRNPPTPKTSP